MPAVDRPQVHPYLSAAPDQRNPRYFVVWDRLGIGPGPLRVSKTEFTCLQFFDGQRTLRDIQAAAMRVIGGELLTLDFLGRLVDKLDAALFLDGPRFREQLASPVREPRCIGCYEGEPAALRKQIERQFTGPKGPGLPRTRKPDSRLSAALVPHIDYPRGGWTYAWGFKEMFESTEASLFVIIGTSHYSSHRFTLTRKDFKTPLGTLHTDQDFIDQLVKHYREGLFDDEPCHLPEHSIELEVVFLQYLYEGRRPIRIVPLVVGSFSDCVADERLPKHQPDIGRMIEALRKAEAETTEPICYLISGDLAHIGPKFGDRRQVHDAQLAVSLKQDQAILKKAEEVDSAGYFQIIADEGDSRRICGLPPTYTVLEAARPKQGKLLHHDRYVHPDGYESVSYASMAFYR